MVIFGEESKVSDWEEACGSLFLGCPSYINLSDLYMGLFNLFNQGVHLCFVHFFLLCYSSIKLFTEKKKKRPL